MEWLIIVALFVVIIILGFSYKSKCDFIKALETDRQNLKMAYQKGLAKDQKTLSQKTESLRNDNSRLLSENKSLVKEILEKDSLFKSIKRDNENLKDENIKLLKELQLERNRLTKEINEAKDGSEEQIEMLQNEVTRLEMLSNSSERKIKELEKSKNELEKTKLEQDEKIERYKEYVGELRSDILEFENAYVAIGGKLSDIYEDYED